MQRQQQGFTLIELVIVIVILGVLSAFALPRFADLGGDARAASIEGLAGSMKSASSVVRSACLASSDCQEGSDSSSVTLEGTTIQTAFGYPTAGQTGIGEAAQISTDDYSLQGSNWGGGAGTSVTLNIDGLTDCQATYTTASGDGDGNLDSPATVTSTTDGC